MVYLSPAHFRRAGLCFSVPLGLVTLRALKTWLTFLTRASLLIAGSLLASVLAFAQAPTPSDALTLQQQGNWRAAAQAWKSITERNPQDAAAFASLGVAFSNEQNYSDASAAYRTALKLNPKLPGIVLNLGLAEFKQGHFSAAAIALKSSIAADPSNLQARTLLGM